MKKWIENQFPNQFLYIPFLMAFGAGLYFCNSTEINLIYSISLFIIAVVGIFCGKLPIVLRGLCIFIFGFCYASLFTHIINTPQIPHNMDIIELVGTVQDIDYTYDKNRILLSVNGNDIHTGTQSAQIRLSIDQDIVLPNIGDKVQVTGTIFKPAAASAPETFDFARWAYFNNLTATGYAKEIKTLEFTQNTSIDNIRKFLHLESDSFLTDTLILGYKSAVPKYEQITWTSTGVGHIWSISGFHMTLVGGWIFALFYLIFRSIPYITRRIPAKIPATVLTWFGLFFYLLLSGTDVATIRAFVMTSLVFIAFIVGRSAISMRNVALAFCLIFFINPHYVMQAGFQLSFAAVFGLVWLYQDLKPKMPQNKLLKVLYALILTSVVATIFTAPFIAAQFGQFPTYSLLGNLIFLPIFSVAIMPLIMLGTITAILGFTYPIHLAHNIYEFAYQIALWISDLPISVVNIPYISNASLILFIIGFICLIAIKSKDIKINYILFVTFVILGIISVHTTRKPVFYSSHDNELVGFVKPDGNIEFNKGRSSKHYFTFDTWKQINGEQIKTPNIRKKHDKGVYRYNTEKFNLVYILKFTSLMNNISQLCNDDNIDFIVSYHDIESKHCKHKILQGGFVIYPNRRIKRAPTNRKWHQ